MSYIVRTIFQLLSNWSPLTTYSLIHVISLTHKSYPYGVYNPVYNPTYPIGPTYFNSLYSKPNGFGTLVPR